MSEINDVFGDVIYSYTRAQALEDGDRYVKVPEGVTCQDESGRLWDILWMCRIQARRLGAGDSEMLFKLHVRNDSQEEPPPFVTLKAHRGPGDCGAAVVTLMLPEEGCRFVGQTEVLR